MNENLPDNPQIQVLKSGTSGLFTNYIYKAIPLAFDESMSYYETLCGLLNYLKNVVIPTVNNNADAVAELQNLYEQLRTYVDDYFTNLDVQDEINNKLDEMVEDGTLPEIVASYLETKAIFGFDNVASMKQATNLINGSYAETLGYYNVNDGGSALYKIRNITNDDVVDNMIIIPLNNDELIAELIIPDKINPIIFGAKGDGINDDTEIIRKTLKYCIDNNKLMFINKKHYISNTILSSTDYDTTNTYIYMNIMGNVSKRTNLYTPDNFGGLIVKNGISLFKDLKIRGSISNLTITPVSRNIDGCIFENCVLNSFAFTENNVSNIGSFLIDSNIVSNSMIKDNRFLTVYYFAKAVNKNISLTDSFIKDNYINGGTELNNNSCFQFFNYNGSIIATNFIDYYRTIYDPINTTNTNTAFEGVKSIGNQYQVFRYFYYKNPRFSSFTITSDSDVFNWTLPSSLQKISDFETLTYTGHDNNTYDLPPYIMMIDETHKISIKNAYLQRNIGNIIFIKSSLGNYNYGLAEFSCNASSLITKYDGNNYVSIANGTIYSGGTYRNNLINIPFIHQLDELPTNVLGWSPYYLGQRIMVNNKLYRRIYDYDTSTLIWKEYHF